MRDCRTIRVDGHPPALGEERFRTIFKLTVEACLKAKIRHGRGCAIDASLILPM
jgi:hypothetical protein